MYKQIGDEVPVEDERGERPEYEDRDGVEVPRELEVIPYAPLAEIELELKEIRVKDRRYIQQALDKISSSSTLAPLWPTEWEATIASLVKRCVSGVRLKETGQEKVGDKAHEMLGDMLEYADQVVLVNFLQREATLTRSKKRNWKSKFA